LIFEYLFVLKEGIKMKRKIKKQLRLSQIYQYLENDELYLVQISLDNYDELFNGWDATPLKRRDLEPELLDFIEQVGYDIPLKEKVKLSFQLPNAKFDKQKEERSKEAIYNNFTMVIHYINKSLVKNNRKIISYIAIGLLFLIFAYFLRSSSMLPVPLSILSEGLFIGGWVMFWEAFSLFFFVSYDSRARRKRFLRFATSDIDFDYHDEQNQYPVE